MNKLGRDILEGEILVMDDGSTFAAHAGNGMKSANMGRSVYAYPWSRDTGQGGDLMNVSADIDATRTEEFQSVNGKFGLGRVTGESMIRKLPKLSKAQRELLFLVSENEGKVDVHFVVQTLKPDHRKMEHIRTAVRFLKDNDYMVKDPGKILTLTDKGREWLKGQVSAKASDGSDVEHKYQQHKHEKEDKG